MSETRKKLESKLNSIEAKIGSLYRELDEARKEKSECKRDLNDAINEEFKETQQYKVGKYYTLGQETEDMYIRRYLYIKEINVEENDEGYRDCYVVADYKESQRSKSDNTINSFYYQKDATLYDTDDKKDYLCEMINFDSLVEVPKKAFDGFIFSLAEEEKF